MDIEARMREVEQEIISRRPEHSVDLALDRMAVRASRAALSRPTQSEERFSCSKRGR